jgi:hypothetical protein
MSESITIRGTVVEVQEAKEFGSNGFRKSVIAVKTPGEYPQEYGIEFVKDKADAAVAALTVGDEVEIECNLRGREYNGKYYTSLQGWKWNKAEGGSEEPAF